MITVEKSVGTSFFTVHFLQTKDRCSCAKLKTMIFNKSDDSVIQVIFYSDVSCPFEINTSKLILILFFTSCTYLLYLVIVTFRLMCFFVKPAVIEKESSLLNIDIV